MRYQIKFTKGDLAGQAFPIDRDSVSVGRSRSNDIVLKTGDVSRKHLIVSRKGRDIFLDNLSVRPTTRCGAVELAMGESIPFRAGMEISIGRENAFVLESLDDGFYGGEATLIPGAAGVSGSDKTVIPDGADAVPVGGKTVIPDGVDSVSPGGKTVIPDGVDAAFSSDGKTMLPGVDAAFSSDGRTILPGVVDPNAGFSPDGRTVPEQAGIDAAAVKGTCTESAKNAETPAAQGESSGETVFPFEKTTGGLKTVGLKTRAATPEEIQLVKDAERKKLRRKSFLIGAGATLLLVLLGVYFYFTLYKAPEPYISWPKKDGRLLVGYARIQDKIFPFPNDLQLGFPNPPSTRIFSQPGVLEITTRTGRYLDVPCFIRLEYLRIPGGLKMDRLDAFERWMNEKSSGKNGWNFDVPSPLQFFFQDNGIPHYAIFYTRTVGRISVCGIARFFRMEDWQFVLTAEIPAHERWRGTTFLKQNFIQFSYDFLYAHWEGMKLTQPVDKENGVYEARMLLSRQSPSVWGRVEYLLRTALICCDRIRDAELRAEARRLLMLLRSTQIKWFNEQKIAYRRAQTLEDKDGMERITEKCKAVFSSPEDMRFHAVRQDNWR